MSELQKQYNRRDIEYYFKRGRKFFFRKGELKMNVTARSIIPNPFEKNRLYSMRDIYDMLSSKN